MVDEAVIDRARPGATTDATALDPVVVANRLRPVLLHLNRHLRRELHALGIGSSQVSLLSSISKTPGIGVAELAAREGTSAPSISNHIDRLEAAGLGDLPAEQLHSIDAAISGLSALVERT